MRLCIYPAYQKSLMHIHLVITLDQLLPLVLLHSLIRLSSLTTFPTIYFTPSCISWLVVRLTGHISLHSDPPSDKIIYFVWQICNLTSCLAFVKQLQEEYHSYMSFTNQPN